MKKSYYIRLDLHRTNLSSYLFLRTSSSDFSGSIPIYDFSRKTKFSTNFGTVCPPERAVRPLTDLEYVTYKMLGYID
jgi:hypothetical protein